MSNERYRGACTQKFRTSQRAARILAKRNAYPAIALTLIGVVLGGIAAYRWTHVQPQSVQYRYTAVSPASAVLTYKSDTSRQGVYGHETALTPQSVASGRLLRSVSYPVDGQVYAQPLFVPNVPIGHGTHNVVIVATEHDSVYAFNADQTAPAPPFWHISLLPKGATPGDWSELFPDEDVAIRPDVGITSTPVIDPSTDTIYVAAMDKEPGKGFVHRLFAIDLSTGTNRSVVVAGSVPGTGDGSKDGVVTFDARQELQRSALLLWRQRVYASYASFGDNPPFHGWMFAYDAKTLRQVAVLNTTPDGSDGGIWSSGGGPALGASDALMYIAVGNGSFDLNTGGRDAGDSILALDPDLTIRDSFTPSNQAELSKLDLDVGSAGLAAATIPTAHGTLDVVFASAKDGHIWILDQHHLGEYDTQNDHTLSVVPASSVVGGVFTTPTYWSDPATGSGYLYVTGLSDAFKAFGIANGAVSATPVTQSSDMLSYPGGTPVVSWNGGTSDSTIVWLLSPTSDSRTARNLVAPGQLRAYAPTDLSHPIYESPAFPYIKFSVPTVAAGHVFVGTGDSLDIYM